MTTRGLHMAIGKAQLTRVLDTLRKLEPLEELEQESLGDVLLEIEKDWDEAWVCETDKAWDAIHRVLGNGTYENSDPPTPLEKAVFGGEELAENEVFLVRPEETVAIAQALAKVTKDWFFQRFDTLLTATDYDGPRGDEDREYSWENFVGLRDFYQRVATTDRAVIFSA